MTSILIYSSSEDSSISYWTSSSDIEEYTEFDYQFSLGIAPINSDNINSITSEKQTLTYKQLSIGKDSGLNIAYLDSFFDSARLEEYYIAFKDDSEEITIKPYWKTPEGKTCSIQIGTPEDQYSDFINIVNQDSLLTFSLVDSWIQAYPPEHSTKLKINLIQDENIVQSLYLNVYCPAIYNI